jgi:hypothetical protein
MGDGCIDPRFLDLGTSWRCVVTFTLRPLYPRRKSPRIHWIGGCVDPRAGMDDVENRKFLPLPGLNSDPSTVQPVASRYTDYATPALC